MDLPVMVAGYTYLIIIKLSQLIIYNTISSRVAAWTAVKVLLLGLF